jgi:hypothetical protein
VDTSKISFGEMVAASSAGVLFVVMFFPWFGASAEVSGGKIQGGNANAWQAFSLIDILLFLVIAVTIGLVIARAAGKIPSEPVPDPQHPRRGRHRLRCAGGRGPKDRDLPGPDRGRGHHLRRQDGDGRAEQRLGLLR